MRWLKIWVLAMSLMLSGTAWSASLVETLVSELGITEDQAIGGAGALMSYAKQDLAEADWAQLAGLVPEASSLAEEGEMGGVAASLGSVLGESDLGMAPVLEQLNALGLDAATISKFTPVVLDYLKQQGGDDLIGTLTQLWSP
ncbi:DUF2780 domain-containing protein [Marinobacter hydrocarbonoclasticus]|nr:DUF2780 domain-containing protein [Marinobacter nauticus]